MISFILLLSLLDSSFSDPRANCTTCGFTRTPLDDYVYSQDDSWNIEVLKSEPGVLSRVDILNVTTITWKQGFADRSTWWHYMVVVVPWDHEYMNKGLFFVGGGSNTDGLPDDGSDPRYQLVVDLAELTGTAIGYMKNLPNQPLRFSTEEPSIDRSDDAAIAYTWGRYLNQENATDPTTLLQFPMVKAALFGMDAFAFHAQRIDPRTLMNEIIVAGSDVHGWVAWLLAAMDTRVMGAAPTTSLFVNIVQGMKAAYRALGGWSWAHRDYFDQGVTSQLDSPNMAKLAALIDPISYVSRYQNVSKMIVAGTSDAFFMPDQSLPFYAQLPGPKLFWMVDNTDHLLGNRELEFSLNLASFYDGVLKSHPLADYRYEFVENITAATGEIRLYTDTQPLQILGWRAETDDPHARRDFRWAYFDDEENNIIESLVDWTEDRDLEVITDPSGNQYYRLDYPIPAQGWTAFYIEAVFSTPSLDTISKSTEVYIIPETYPFPPCTGQQCTGRIV